MSAITALIVLGLPAGLQPLAPTDAPAQIDAPAATTALADAAFDDGLAASRDAAQGASSLPEVRISVEPSLFAGEPVAEDVLAETSGREQANWLQATTTNVAQVSDNKVGDNAITGAVNVSDAAFQGVSGISMVNFNTGNNSAINAGMSVNLQINYAQPGQ